MHSKNSPAKESNLNRTFPEKPFELKKVSRRASASSNILDDEKYYEVKSLTDPGCFNKNVTPGVKSKMDSISDGNKGNERNVRPVNEKCDSIKSNCLKSVTIVDLKEVDKKRAVSSKNLKSTKRNNIDTQIKRIEHESKAICDKQIITLPKIVDSVSISGIQRRKKLARLPCDPKIITYDTSTQTLKTAFIKDNNNQYAQIGSKPAQKKSDEDLKLQKKEFYLEKYRPVINLVNGTYKLEKIPISINWSIIDILYRITFHKITILDEFVSFEPKIVNNSNDTQLNENLKIDEDNIINLIKSETHYGITKQEYEENTLPKKVMVISKDNFSDSEIAKVIAYKKSFQIKTTFSDINSDIDTTNAFFKEPYDLVFSEVQVGETLNVFSYPYSIPINKNDNLLKGTKKIKEVKFNENNVENNIKKVMNTIGLPIVINLKFDIYNKIGQINPKYLEERKRLMAEYNQLKKIKKINKAVGPIKFNTKVDQSIPKFLYVYRKIGKTNICLQNPQLQVNRPRKYEIVAPDFSSIIGSVVVSVNLEDVSDKNIISTSCNDNGDFNVNLQTKFDFDL